MIKIAIYLSPGSIKDVQAKEKAFSPQKITSITIIFLIFFLFLWVNFALLDPDPDSESGSTDLDPDPEHCSKQINLLVVFFPVADIQLGCAPILLEIEVEVGVGEEQVIELIQ